MIPISPALPPPRVTVSLQDSQWVAQRDGRVLWSYKSYKSYDLHARDGDLTVLGIFNKKSGSSLLVTDGEGAVLSNLPLYSEPDPRTLMLGGRFVVYDTNVLGIAHYESRAEGRQIWNWLNQYRHVRAYDIRGFNKLVWDRSELAVGMPLALHGGYLETLYIVNAQECLENDWMQHRDSAGHDLVRQQRHYPMTPRIAVVEWGVVTGRVRRRALLRLTRAGAIELYQDWFGSEPVVGEQHPHVAWAGQRVCVCGLFGRNYVGHR